MTSKIPVDLINKAKMEKQDSNELSSPYTKEGNKKNKICKLIIFMVIIIVSVILGYVIVSIHKGNDFSDNNITYSIRR